MRVLSSLPPRFSLELTQFLESHLKQKFANSDWLFRCLSGNASFFPYRLDAKGKGTVLKNRFYYPEEENPTELSSPSSNAPKFIVNIPEGRSLKLGASDEVYQKILKILKTEAFGSTPSSSRKICQSRLAVIIGTNQMESLDPKFNRAFRKVVRKTVKVAGLVCKRFGFLWRPAYQRIGNVVGVYPIKKSFLIVKALNKKVAETVRSLLEASYNIRPQIPYQEIRETILKSRPTRSVMDQMQNRYPHSAVYLTTMDADFLQLRKDQGEGIFSRITAQINPANPYTVIGAGYQAQQNELPFIRYAVEMDMAVRAAMLRIIPYSAYLPEPLLCVLAKAPNQNSHLSNLSFVGNGSALESRRLLENGRKKGLFTNHAVFLEEGIVTTSPERWKTIKNQENTTFSKKVLKSKSFLQALRGLSQSHTHPKKWADQVYVVLNFTASKVTDATAPMMHIFGVFDPISRMFAMQLRFTSNTFDTVMREYQSRRLTDVEKDILQSAKTRLKKLNMPNNLISTIIEAAKASGKAIYQKLHNIEQSL